MTNIHNKYRNYAINLVLLCNYYRETFTENLKKQSKLLNMKDLTKEEKLKKILEKVDKDGLTGYYIAEKTGLTESGLNKLFRGDVKRPHTATINTLYSFLYGNVTANEDVADVVLNGKDVMTVIEWLYLYEDELIKFPMYAKWIEVKEKRARNEGYKKCLEKHGEKEKTTV